MDGKAMIPIYKPYMPEVPLLNEILQSGKLAYGEYGKEFERLLSDYFDTKNLIVTNTFNMAILVALSTLGIKAGDAVIVSPMACLASTQPLLSMGITVVWADVNPLTGTLDPESVRQTVANNPKAKAIIHNHFCGHLGFIDEINALGREFGIPVIDDGIEAFGSIYKNKKIGNVGTDVTIFSFNPVRIPNTLDGGLVIFKDEALHKKSLLVRDAGIDRTRFRDGLGEIRPDCDIDIMGHSATPIELNSYIGIQQMKKVDWIIETQRSNAAKWDEILQIQDDIEPLQIRENLPNYWVYGTLAKDKRKSLIKFREKGYYASSVHLNNNFYSVFGKTKSLIGVKNFYNHFLALPCGWWFNK